MKLSTRNQLQGKVKSVDVQGLMAKVVLDLGGQTISKRQALPT